MRLRSLRYLLLFVSLIITINASADVEVNATNFPDEAFRNWVLQNIEGASDGELTDTEIAKVKTISCSSKSISSLQGIEYFTALVNLDCHSNQLTSLDLSKNTALTELTCSNNLLTSLDVSGCSTIVTLECVLNQLTSLDLSKNTSLYVLSCYSNQLTSLDVSKNTALTRLFCYSNQLTSLDVSKNTALTELSCYSNQLANLDLSKNTSLIFLDCHYNRLTSLDVSKNVALKSMYCSSNQLTSLDVSKNTSLTYLECQSNKLTFLDVSGSLTYLECQSNKLTFLDVSKNTSLTHLECQSNQLTSLDVSKNTSLTYLYCQSNQLTSLDVSKNTALTRLSCHSNHLTSLDVSKNTSLTYLECQSNQLTSLDVSKNTALRSLDCSSNQLTNLDLSKNKSITSGSVSPQSLSLTAVDFDSSFAIPISSDFDLANVSIIKLYGYYVTTSISTVDGQKYLVFQSSTNQSSIDGEALIYTYKTGNSYSKLSSMDVTITLSYTSASYFLSIQSGNGGSVTFNGTEITNTTKSFVVNSGNSVTLSITPNSGYRLASLVVNDTNVTSSVINNQYTISDISTNTTVVATFEVIPPTTYTLSIQSGSGGSVTYNGTTITNTTRSFTVNEGTTATISISPNSGYMLASLTVNGTNVTSSVSNNQYTINSITANTTVVATFEQINYSLSIQSGSGGSVSYNGTVITNTTKSFTITHGSSATITVTPNTGYKLSSLTVNGTNVTSGVSNNQYTINSITANTTVVVSFVENLQSFSQDGISYQMTSAANKTLNVSAGNYSGHVIIPASVSYEGETWSVRNAASGVFNNAAITAITWNPKYALSSNAFGNQTNPNLLLYVQSASYAPSNVQNVITNGKAKKIVLTDAASGNDFDCPESFTAEEISYTHKYNMTTGINDCRGWETIALPFTVQKVMHQSKGQMVAFKQWDKNGDTKPYWLYKLSSTGFVEADFIEANTPYIISMPNNDVYYTDYNLSGSVTFSAQNATVKSSENLTTSTSNGKTFKPCFTKKAKASFVYAVNAVNDLISEVGGYKEGSVFIENLRPILPFEAYMTTSSGNAKRAIPIFEDLPTAIREIPATEFEGEKGLRIYTTTGNLVLFSETLTLQEALKRLPRGVYIINGKKLAVK